MTSLVYLPSLPRRKSLPPEIFVKRKVPPVFPYFVSLTPTVNVAKNFPVEASNDTPDLSAISAR